MNCKNVVLSFMYICFVNNNIVLGILKFNYFFLYVIIFINVWIFVLIDVRFVYFIIDGLMKMGECILYLRNVN